MTRQLRLHVEGLGGVGFPQITQITQIKEQERFV
jgi:hypothetical protein